MSKITVEPDARAPLVPIWGELRIPSALTVRAELENEVTITLDIEIEGERRRCRRLEVQAPEDAEVTGELLRQIPVARWMDWAIAAQAYEIQSRASLPDEPSSWPAGFEVRTGGDLAEREIAVNPVPQVRLAAAYDQYARNARRPRRGSPVTDEHLSQVAEIYRAALKRGDPPAVTIAQRMNVARSTAARWVGLARSRGFLGPSIPGRAGEAATTED